MLKLAVTLSVLSFMVRSRIEKRVNERGLGTLEMVVIALGLFALAGAAVLVIETAVKSRTEKIK